MRWTLKLDGFDASEPFRLFSFEALVDAVLRGGLLEFFQWRVLREVLPTLAWRSWVGATVIGLTLDALLGSAPLVVFGSPDLVGQNLRADPGVGVMLLVAGLWGLLLSVVSIGVAQAFVLRRYVHNARRWVVVNALGTLVPAVVFGIASTAVAFAVGWPILPSPTEAMSFPAFVVSSVLVRTAFSVVVAIVTGTAIGRLVPRLPSANVPRDDVHEV